MFPKDEKKWLEVVHMSRRAYNLALEHFFSAMKNREKLEKTQVRKLVRAQVKQEQAQAGREFVSSTCDEASDRAYRTCQALFREWKKGKAAKPKFKSIKEVRQSFILQKLPSRPLFRQGGCHITEEVPDEALGQMATVVLEHGRWFICVKKLIPLKRCLSGAESQGLRVCAVDPGVRTFLTTYSNHEVIEYGAQFVKVKLLPLFNKIKRLISRRDRLRQRKDKPGWVHEILRHLTKRISRLRVKQQDLVNDLHKRVAYDLVTSYDIIFLPTFETKRMSRKSRRKIGRLTALSMLSLGHYRFAQTIRWMARKYGKVVLACDESYTSKTGWDGKVYDIKGRKTMVIGGVSVDRDHNGARNILIKSLSSLGANLVPESKQMGFVQ